MRVRMLLSVCAAFLLVADGGAAFAQSAPPEQTVTMPEKSAVSPRLSELPTQSWTPPGKPPVVIPLRRPPGLSIGPGGGPPAFVQTRPGPQLHIRSKSSFPGVGATGYIPPDPNIAVGRTTNGVGYIMQGVNASVAIYNKSSGALVRGPVALKTFWSALGGACSLNNGGDPVVQYDAFADRWIISQIGSLSAPYYQCVAVSTSNDPTGSYRQYAYSFGNYLNDYPKFGVWPTASNSAYLASYNLFYNGASFSGASLCAYDRAAMLNGDAAPKQICVSTPEPSFLPADVDGATAPADGTNPLFADLPNNSTLRLYEMAGVDFASATPAVSLVKTDIGVSSFSYACGGGTCVPQPGTSRQLDSLGDRLMYRLAYRVFPDHASMVVNHAVTAGTSVGVRWYELRESAAASSACDGSAFDATHFYRCQQATFSPDAAYRWMGSAAMDGSGKIAIGYSKSSGVVYPSVAFAGRTPDMAPDVLGAENTLQQGAGSQTGYSRWGDYTSLRIDPDDDTTFWYTNEYYTATSSYSWSTVIASFAVSASPATSPDFTLAAPSALSVTRGSSGGVTVTATAVNGSSTVNLSVSGVPRATSAAFSPIQVIATGTSTLTIKASKTATRGTYPLTITGTNGGFSHAAPLSLTIN